VIVSIHCVCVDIVLEGAPLGGQAILLAGGQADQASGKLFPCSPVFKSV
jgi:hypothetical protein